MSKILGIDLGTTNSAFAVIEGGEPKILENAEGMRTTPSVVAIAKNGDRLVGVLAKRQSVTNPKNTIFQIKRFVGHTFDEPNAQKDIKAVPFETRKSENGGIDVKMGDPAKDGAGKWYRPEEISAMILQKLKTDAEARLGTKITEAVITVPAYFNDAQRKATKDAGQIAGLDVKRIINEPTAAALAYGFNKKKNEKIAVFDFGGGTFDISVLEVGEDVVEVKSTDGDAHLGGKDIDQKIINWLADGFQKEHGVDLRKDALSKQRLDDAAEKAKIELSTAVESEINLPFITSTEAGPVHLVRTMKRADLEEICREFVDRAMMITKRAMEASPFKVGDINEVILVGGQTRMPMIQKAVQDFFGRAPHMGVNPDEVVALGAAVQAGVLQGDVKDVLLLDVIPLSLGIETLGSVATKLVERNTTIPSSKSQVFSTAADNQTSVEIHIVQGERPMASDNKSLGRFILDGIPPSPRGMPQIEVTFDVDANGILNVKAVDKASGKTQSIRIEASSGLKEEDIKKMQADAELHAEEDKKKKEIADVKNTAEMITYTAEKALKDNDAKIPQDLKESVNAKITILKDIKGGTDINAIKKATEELSSEMSKIGEAISKAAPAADAPGAAPSGDAASAKDAEFKEKPKDEGEAPKV
ncbi:molecular chaperone DnaK [Candidatus Nomurabacteria bacterium RIFCSPLOWO2_12_FULL_44_11]|uniref:Chaperone protein DnaK n=1 Tax=Candidatus Nomurabacteria bacterium RIFCSPLOWO2_12_FULL_44_11 TaxID=1801796 RepID=A0A1F6Y4S1_9BACT|nr:MAG: molecular chaperone DnaK [Candidatus Nomurabacteria bacterium RIFCSPLOWO2_12_FULL_44_11]